MEVLLINILILWYIMCSYITNISATVRFETGTGDPARYKKRLFREYYLNLPPYEETKTVIEDNEVLGNELCHTLGSAFGERFYNDPGGKRCKNIEFFLKQVQVEESYLIWIKLGKCSCFGKKPLKTFYIREYTIDDNISVYFVFCVTGRQHETHPKYKYLTLISIFDAAYNIVWEEFFPESIQGSKLTPPPKNKKEKDETQNENLPAVEQQEGNQPEKTNAA